MPEKIKFSNLLTKKQYAIVIAFFVFVFGLLLYTFLSPNHYNVKAPVRFEVKYGESLSSVAERLLSKGVIQGKTNFKIMAYLLGAEKRLKAGRYNIENDLSYFELVSLFTGGEADILKEVKIYEGKSIKDIAAQLKIELNLDSASFMNVCIDVKYLDSLKLNEPSLEGYLLPGKYLFFENCDIKEVTNKMYSALLQYQKQINLSKRDLHEVLTMASIVDGETNKKDEMPVIAGVYYNRLHSGMKLQADPTIQYILNEKWRRLYYEDLRIKSPYNTYIHKGLPPGPIGNPGKDAIYATINYKKHKYFFFVASGTGGHLFAENYKQHLENVSKYRNTIGN